MAADIVFRDVRIVDGSGAPAREGDLAVEGGRITAVAAGGTGGVGEAGTGGIHEGPGTRVVDGAGLVLAPGFVDTHTHDDAALVLHPGLEFKVAQGCTSLVVGNCGFSAFPSAEDAMGDGGWGTLAGFRATVEADPIAANAVALVGHNTVRSAVVGAHEQRPPTPAEQAAMRDVVARAMDDGACGFSTGLVYTPGRWAATDEITDLATAAAASGGLYATHMRNEADDLLPAVEEALGIGRAAGCPVHISHHKAMNPENWGRVVDSLARVDAANAGGMDVTLDVYPYTAASGPMHQYVDLDDIDLDWAGRTRLASCPAHPGYEGRALPDIAAAEGIGLDDLVRKVLGGDPAQARRVVSITFLMDEADVETNLRHPRMMVGSDGIPDLSGNPHPRLFGTFPRVLGRYVRERSILPLEEAVRRMTSLSCERFGLTGRGRLAEGWWADLVLFDPDAVEDRATYDDPKREPAGIACVVVNGEVVVDAGHHTGARPGRLLRYRSGGAG
jgi:N-acyl-D-aspartate/D-glutamate deacylase